MSFDLQASDKDHRANTEFQNEIHNDTHDRINTPFQVVGYFEISLADEFYQRFGGDRGTLRRGVRKCGVSYPVEMGKDWEARFKPSERREWPPWILLLLFLLFPIPFVSLWVQLVIAGVIIIGAMAFARKKQRQRSK